MRDDEIIGVDERELDDVALEALAEAERAEQSGEGTRVGVGKVTAVPEATVDVKAMGDRTHHAPAALRDEMRQAVSDEVQRVRPHGSGSFVLDGSIKTLTTSTHADLVEVTCEVELVLSTGHKNAIIMTSTAGASVQRARRQYRPAMQAALEREAMRHAVRGATDELRQHLAANVP